MYVPRNVKTRFNKVFENYNMVAVIGARQAGKTTFLKQNMKNRNAFYVLFDDPDALELFESDIKKFEMQYVDDYELTVLDEVHYCKDAGKKLKYLVDNDQKLWITSSSEMILSKDVLSFLVGRISIIRLYPFNFQEFLISKGQKALTQTIVERNVWEHILYGGYPKVVLTKEKEMKQIILHDLFETILFKDVSRTFNINDLKSLELCVRYLAINTGTLLSYNEISKSLGISFPTLKKYLNAMEKSHLIILVRPYFTNKTKEITKQPKVYFLDTGLRNSIAREFNTDIDGKIFENYVLSEIIKTGIIPKYWRTKAKAEVDFVLEIDNSIIPIEVKIKAEPPKIERSFRSFIQTYHPEKAVIVTYRGNNGETEIDGCKVIYTDITGLKKLLKYL